MDDQNDKNRRRLRWALAVLGVVVIAVAGVVLFSGGSEQNDRATPRPQPNARDVASQFMKAATENNGTASYDLMTRRLQEQLGNTASWRRYLDTSFGRTEEGLTFIETKDVPSSTNPKPVQVFYDVDFGGTAIRRVDLTLLYTDGSWKVDEFTVSAKEQ